MISTILSRSKPVKETLNDDYYVNLSKQDISGFRYLYDKYYIPIYRFIQKRIGDQELSNDLTSQVFLKAIQSLDKYENRGFPFSSWLYRIASNEIAQHFRTSKNKNQIYIDDLMAQRIANDLESENVEQDLVFLEKVMGLLEPEDSDLIQYRFFDDLSYQQIAEITGLTENNARVKVFRVIQRLKIEMNLLKNC